MLVLANDFNDSATIGPPGSFSWFAAGVDFLEKAIDVLRRGGDHAGATELAAGLAALEQRLKLLREAERLLAE